MMNNELKLAVLIDADNISDKYVTTILDESTKYGTATYRRIYGDWTDTQLSSWKQVLLDNSILPFQQYSYTYGKNATDSAMIIDAMDLLYTGSVDGFCIVSSDSDFTRLAARLRESGMYVIGMGESKTPKPFISACNEFKYLDILLQEQEKESGISQNEEKAVKPKKTASGRKPRKTASAKESAAVVQKESPTPQTKLITIKKAILSLVKECSDEDGWIHSSELKNQLVKRFPDFDVRNFGCSKFNAFIDSLNILERRQEQTTVLFSLKNEAVSGQDPNPAGES